MMPNIVGEIQREGIPDYNWEADIIYFDMPLLSLFSHGNNQYSMFLWIDFDNHTNRWAVIDVEPSLIVSYLKKDIPLLNCVRSAKNILIIDSPDMLEQKIACAVRVNFETLCDLGYCPTEESFLSDGISNMSPDEQELLISRLEKLVS